MLKTRLSPGRGHHHLDADYANRGTQQVPPVWPEAANDYAPRQRERDEDATVSSVHPPELRDGLHSRHNAVGREDRRPRGRTSENTTSLGISVDKEESERERVVAPSLSYYADVDYLYGVSSSLHCNAL